MDDKTSMTIDAADKRRLQNMVEDIDQGRRKPKGAVAWLLFAVALAWSAFQIYVATDIPIQTGVLLLGEHEQRLVHLAFAMFLGFATVPMLARSATDRIPLYDWALALLAVGACLYVLFTYGDIARRMGGIQPAPVIVTALIGLICLVELTRRSVGLPMVLVCAVFTAFAFAGPRMPDLIAHRGASGGRYMEHIWLAGEGVFGLALGVSNSFIFLFVLFGSLLDKAGAGNFFTQLAFSMLGHMRGGPAKAAVVSSALTGVISGSTIANIVTTGTFTIPMMRRIGFSAERAAAVEVSSSLNGQIMPPVMGAAAFIMTEFIGIPYFDVVKHAFLPALISYIGLFYIVHLEAVKSDMPVLPRRIYRPWTMRIVLFALGFGGVVLIAGAVYGVGQVLHALAGAAAEPIALLLVAAAYVALLYVSAQMPDLEHQDPDAPLEEIPPIAATLLTGLHYFIPIGALIWCLMVERWSPALSVLWAIAFIVAIMLTQAPLKSLFRKAPTNARLLAEDVRTGFLAIIDGMVAGARNMVSVVLALASAGIIVGIVSLTGLGLQMTTIVEVVSGGYLSVMLVMTAIMCVILGMGLPTTANYIVVVSVMAHPILQLASQNGLIIPAIAVHLFVFYFGLISGTTPPVAVDAFAGAAVARANPLKTCVISFFYTTRTALLPFIFVFNTELLLVGVSSVTHFLEVLVISTVAMLVFVAASQAWLFVRCTAVEVAALLLVAFTLMRPGFWLDQVYEPYAILPGAEIVATAQSIPADTELRVKFAGETLSGRPVEKVVALPLGPADRPGEIRLLESAGIKVATVDGGTIVDDVRGGSPAQDWGIGYDWRILEVQVANDRPAKDWFYIPALMLLALVCVLQWRRKARHEA